MKLLDRLFERIGYVRKDRIKSQLNFEFSVGKRLDEHRELVETISQRFDLSQCWWCIGHMATQDDYLMRLYHMVHDEWPENKADETTIQKSGELVRPRPSVLGPCDLLEYPG